MISLIDHGSAAHLTSPIISWYSFGASAFHAALNAFAFTTSPYCTATSSASSSPISESTIARTRSYHSSIVQFG